MGNLTVQHFDERDRPGAPVAEALPIADRDRPSVQCFRINQRLHVARRALAKAEERAAERRVLAELAQQVRSLESQLGDARRLLTKPRRDRR